MANTSTSTSPYATRIHQCVKRVLFHPEAFDSNMPASFTCPNCDGEITEAEHDAYGLCGDCMFALEEHVQHEHECMH